MASDAKELNVAEFSRVNFDTLIPGTHLRSPRHPSGYQISQRTRFVHLTPVALIPYESRICY
ncbi:hypothetical protein B0H12DRAFT_1140061 [Mycena haematopus]|nr:hypothetical protein B0H12DRAFT_1140061 [Mycena haematopus]